MKKLSLFVTKNLTWIGLILLFIYWVCFDRSISLYELPVNGNSIFGKFLLSISVILMITGLLNQFKELVHYIKNRKN